jgi:hypothetical protein
MLEPAPSNLDEEGIYLWGECTWIIEGGSVFPSVPLKLQALAIRRQLRDESKIAECKEVLMAFHAILQHKNISPPMLPGVQEALEKRVARLLGKET